MEERHAKVAPDYHVTVDYMHYSEPFALIGRQVDVRMTTSSVALVAEHPRLRGRKGQYSTVVVHMPDNHRAQESLWSKERFLSWAARVGPETGETVGRLVASHAISERSFVACRNILGLSKSYSPELLERACARSNELGTMPSYTGLKNSILAIRAADAEARSKGRAPLASRGPGEPVDRAKSAGRTNGADAYRRGGDGAC